MKLKTALAGLPLVGLKFVSDASGELSLTVASLEGQILLNNGNLPADDDDNDKLCKYNKKGPLFNYLSPILGYL